MITISHPRWRWTSTSCSHGSWSSCAVCGLILNSTLNGVCSSSSKSKLHALKMVIRYQQKPFIDICFNKLCLLGWEAWVVQCLPSDPAEWRFSRGRTHSWPHSFECSRFLILIMVNHLVVWISSCHPQCFWVHSVQVVSRSTPPLPAGSDSLICTPPPTGAS